MANGCKMQGSSALHTMHARSHARGHGASKQAGTRCCGYSCARKTSAPSKRSGIDHHDSVGPSVSKPSERTESEALQELCSGQQRT